jgi:hypothetical protein
LGRASITNTVRYTMLSPNHSKTSGETDHDKVILAIAIARLTGMAHAEKGTERLAPAYTAGPSLDRVQLSTPHCNNASSDEQTICKPFTASTGFASSS